MDFLHRLILTLLYLFWLPVMGLGRLLGRDPLQLKKPQGKSYWLVRQSPSTPQSYASENSENEGRPTFREGAENGSRVGVPPILLTRILRRISKYIYA